MIGNGLVDSMSKWIKNTSTDSIWPDAVVGTAWLEVMYEDGTTDKGQAHGWGYSWNTCHRDHITQYRVLDNEQGAVQEPNKDEVEQGWKEYAEDLVNSEWIENTRRHPGFGTALYDDMGIEVEFVSGERLEGYPSLWYQPWDTRNKEHIVRYRLLGTPTPVGEAREPSGVEPNKEQVGGDHYKSLSIQPWDAMEVWLTPEQFQGYLLGSAIKYLGRYNADRQGKGGMEDVKKAIHFLNKLVQVKGGE